MRPVLIVLALLLAAGLLIGKLKGGSSSAAPKKLSGPIVEALNETYGGPLCIHEGPFPKARRDVCLFCKDLEAAGLLEEVTMRQADGSTIPGVDLSKEGQAVYDPAAPVRRGEPRPGFCIGKAQVAEVLETLAPLSLGGVSRISVRFKLRIFDRAPFIYSPAAAQLKQFAYLPLAQGSEVTRPMITTLSFMPNGDFLEADASFRYGKWLDEK